MKKATLLLILIFAVAGTYAQNDDPYAIFGHKSAVKYESKVRDFLYIKNTDTCSNIKAIALDAGSGKIFLLGTDDCVIQSYDVEPTEILTWVSVDPKADKYPSLSPYNYVANNPLNAIDPNGRDIVVLNDPNRGSGFGHMAVLVGNDKTGWTFISKEGRAKGVWYSNDLTGGPASQPIISTFPTLEAFSQFQKVDEKMGGYTQNVRFKTDANQDNNAKKETAASATNWYSALFSNCADATSDGLIEAGLDPGYTYTINAKTGLYNKTLDPRPSVRFDRIKANNAEITVPTYPSVPPVNTKQSNPTTDGSSILY